MGPRRWWYLFFTLLNSFLFIWADWRVFQPRAHASALLHRSKRANTFLFEELFQGNLERECMEERCSYEEAREYFEDVQKTHVFWTIYYDGDQCDPNPCLNGGRCTDRIGGYSCNCTELYQGANCETDVSQCPLEGPHSCSHFCRPTFESFQCLCAKGYSLHSNKKTCVPAVKYPCGRVQTNLVNQVCPQDRCPWQVSLVDEDGGEVCSGVILGPRSVLTSAGCLSTAKNTHLVTGEWTPGTEPHNDTPPTHYNYSMAPPEDDLAFLQLSRPLPFDAFTYQLCLPERDFCENILMKAGKEGAVTTRRGSPPPARPRFRYITRDDCRAHLNLSMPLTNKMFCMEAMGGAFAVGGRGDPCSPLPGTPVATMVGGTAFLTGILRQPGSHDCRQGVVFSKVSRYLPWLQKMLDTAEA